MPTTTTEKSVPALTLITVRVQAIKKHADAFRSYASVALAAPIALGAEILKLHSDTQPKRGRKRIGQPELSNSENIPWKEMIQEETGYSWEYCRRMMKATEAAIVRLEETKEPHLIKAAKTLLDPPADWSLEDYQGLGEIVGAVFDAPTFTGLLIEAGVVKSATANLESKTDADAPTDKPKKRTAKDDARAWGYNLHVALETDVANEKDFLKRLRHIDLERGDNKKDVGLRDLEHSYQAGLTLIKKEINRREPNS